MTRRSARLLALPVLLSTVMSMAACGEQTPGGSKVDVPEGQQQAQDGGGQQSGGQAEQAADADNPIVVKIGEEEFRTNMAIYRKYEEAKSGPLALQAPTAPAEEIAGGKKQDFVTGTIYWSTETGAHIVRGQILKTYLDNGGPEGKLGYPTGDETTEGDTVYSDFQNGRIQLKDRAIQVIEKG